VKGTVVRVAIGTTLAVSLGACGSAGARESCDRLDSQLAQLRAASDRSAFAHDHGLEVTGDRVRVVVETNGGLQSDADIQVESSYASDVLGEARIDRLCALAARPNVLLVRPATRGIPLGSPP